MIRQTLFAAAAIAATFTAVAATAETQPKVSVDAKTGNYCLSNEAVTGSRIDLKECRSVAEWAKQGVTFAAPARQLAAK